MKWKSIFLCACILSLAGCSSNDDSGGLSLYTNEYASFEDFSDHNSQLSKMHFEGSLFLFPLVVSPSDSIVYEITGVDYEHPYGHKGTANCDSLYYREAFALVTIDESIGAAYVVSYCNDQTDFDSLSWHDEMETNGRYNYSDYSGRYNYSDYYLGDNVQYCLENGQNQTLVYAKINKKSNANSTQDVLDTIMRSYKAAKNI